MNKIIKVVLAVAVVIAIGGSYVFPKVQEKFGAVPGSTFTEAVEFLGGSIGANSYSTSTSLSATTLLAGELANKDTIFVIKTGAVATTTVTLPASSTLSYWLPKIGMSQRKCFLSGTSTQANPGFILAAGTGIDLETSSTTPTGLTVEGGSGACITFVRDNFTDIKAFMTVFKNAD